MNLGFEVHRNGSDAMLRNVSVALMAFLTLVDLLTTHAVLLPRASTVRPSSVATSAR